MIIQRHKLENSSAHISKWRLKHPIRRSRKPLAQRKKIKPHIKHIPITYDIDVQNCRNDEENKEEEEMVEDRKDEEEMEENRKDEEEDEKE